MDPVVTDPWNSKPPSDALDKVIMEARKEGIYAGLTSGLASAVIGQKLLRFNRNTTLLCGTLSSLLAGYLFTRAFTDTAIAQLHAEERRQHATSANSGSTVAGNVSSSSSL